MPVLFRIPNIPKPLEFLVPVKQVCPKCKKETLFYVFEADANYAGPIVFMPVAKLLPGKRYLICMGCLHMMPIKDEDVDKIPDSAELDRPLNDGIKLAMYQCLKALAKVNSKEQNDHKKRTNIDSAIIDYAHEIISLLNEFDDSQKKIWSYCNKTILFDVVKRSNKDTEAYFENNDLHGLALHLQKTDYTSQELIMCSECYAENYVGDIVCRDCGKRLDYSGFYEDE